MTNLTERAVQLLQANLNGTVQRKLFAKAKTKSGRGIAIGYSAQAGRVLIADANGYSARAALPKTALAGQQTFSLGNTNVSWRA